MIWNVPNWLRVRRPKPLSKSACRCRLSLLTLESRVTPTITSFGDEIQVNASSSDGFARDNPAVAMGRHGEYVVAWQGPEADATGPTDIYVQRFFANGMPNGEVLNATDRGGNTNGYQINASIGIDDEGDIVVVWQDNGDHTDVTQGVSSANGIGINGVLLQQNGTTFTNTPIAPYTFEVAGLVHPIQPAVAMADGGNFAVVWSASEEGLADPHIFRVIQMRQYDATGMPIVANATSATNVTDAFDEFGVDITSTEPTVAIDNSGNVTVVWSNNFGESQGGPWVNGRAFNSSLSSTYFETPAYSQQDQTRLGREPTVSLADDGTVFMAWSAFDVTSEKIFARRYTVNWTTPSVAPADLFGAGTSRQQVNVATSANLKSPALAQDRIGNVAITWVHSESSSDTDVYAQLVNFDGYKTGREILVDAPNAGVQKFTHDGFGPQVSHNGNIAMDDDGNFVIVYQGQQAPNQIGIDSFAQQFKTLNFASSAVATLSNGWSIAVREKYIGTEGSDTSNSFALVTVANSVSTHFDVGRFDTNYTGRQTSPSVAASPNTPRYVITWSELTPAGDWDVFYRVFHGTIPVTDVERANVHTADDQKAPDVTYVNDGFVITWQSWNQRVVPNDANSVDGSWGIFFRKFNLDGVAVDDDPQNPKDRHANIGTANLAEAQYDPAIAANASGNFVIAYAGGLGVWAGTYNSAGTPVLSEVHVNQYRVEVESNPDVAMRSDGSYLVVWQSEDPFHRNNGIDPPLTAADAFAIAGRYVELDGDPLGNEFTVANSFGHDNFGPRIGIDGSNKITVVWQQRAIGSEDWSIMRRLYDASGAGGNTVQVNTVSGSGNQIPILPAIAVRANGEALVIWTELGTVNGREDSVFGHRLDANGDPIGDDFPVLVTP